MRDADQITQLLEALSDGDKDAMDDLVPLIYQGLRDIAHYRLAGERSGHTLSTTALVNEAYLKLVNLDRIRWNGRAHFFAIASQTMRRVLVNYAIERKAQKRGGGQTPVSLTDDLPGGIGPSEELLALDQAIDRLEAVDPRHSRIVECRFFGGMSIEETAEALDLSPATVKRDWVLARAWLNRELASRS